MNASIDTIDIHHLTIPHTYLSILDSRSLSTIRQRRVDKAATAVLRSAHARLTSLKEVENLLPGMPKKTKREKIIAEYRRKLHGIRESVPASPEQVNNTLMSEQTESPPLFIYQKKAMPSYTPAAVVQPMDRAIRRDLVKTLILAAVAIGGEVALSRIVR